MINLTSLERSVLEQMIFEEIKDIDRARLLVSTVRPTSRTFSPDAMDIRRCAGFYINISDCEFLGISPEKPRFSVQAFHPSLSIGADFILFKESSEGAFLEATFYGESLLIEDLISPNHGFILG
ncbi:hypothetical protein H8L32_00640 [Undibacterium sp. CY18W]|uniref:AMMECR1 domain-containing protein n=1 Tax=Undibacterium hunanense TaxID=2762292 RepID=A0ABR6ZJ97_9BURK|nr:hypothetical protein [Undibacterium hunanense]MBC3915978.1 hypothetical protein [Undibacterium hunanense]